MMKRFLAWLADANGWSGVRFDPAPTYRVEIASDAWMYQGWLKTALPWPELRQQIEHGAVDARFDGSHFTLYINGRKVSE